MNEKRLAEILSDFHKNRIAVVGDLFLDKLLIIDRSLDESSLETGLPAYQVTRKRISAGAAGNVLCNLNAIGNGKLYAISAIGRDGEGYELLQYLEARGVDTRYVQRSEEIFTPTYTKPMHLREGRETEGNRLDFVNIRPMPEKIQDEIIRSIDEVLNRVDAILIQDQITRENTGVITERVRTHLAHIAKAHPEKVIFVDSRAYIDRFRDMIIKCNDKEAMQAVFHASGDQFDLAKVLKCFQYLRETTGCEAFITCGEHGVCVEGELVPTAKLNCELDICGCGDACSSGIVSALTAGASSTEAAWIGNLSASVTACKVGTTGTASPEEIMERYKTHFAKSV